ncbi:MAG: carbohydrate kinase family protein [Candidatus Peregrinibacteria bacterium]|nr:carbohydrate kinase family protein [Candidatus Peregrinibacteria bacterium]MCB9808015.1 carbohydrate kinase family protein [Candidatus Peribacteria bacterium]
MKILVTGSAAYDILLGYDGSFQGSLRTSSESITAIYLTSHFARHHGGTAANIAWGLNLLGTDPLMVATVGRDGEEYKELLQSRGIDTTHVEKIDTEVTSTAMIGTDSDGNQVGFFHAGADTRGTWPDLADDREDIAYAIISPREESVMLKAVEYCKTFSVPYFFDPGQRISSMNSDDMKRCIEGSFGLIANEYEWEVIKERLGYTPTSVLEDTMHLIVTRGEHGVSHFDAGGTQSIGGCKADRVVNPTGAGDAFRAGLLHGLASKMTIEESLKIGNAMGSFAVEIEGTLLNTLDKDAVWQRAGEAYKKAKS